MPKLVRVFGVDWRLAPRASYTCGVGTIDDALHAIRPEPEGELPPLPVELDLVGLAEAAELLGIGRSALWERRHHASFPLPVAELRCGPVWFRHQIEQYRLSEARLGPRGRHGRRLRPNAAERGRGGG